MAISSSVSIIAISAVMLLLFKAGPAESRPAESRPVYCPECIPQEIERCPEVVANATCTVVQMEGCSCCPTACAGRLGEKCGSGRAPCDDSLDCLPPRIQEDDYEFDMYDPSFPSFEDGNWVCQPKVQLLPPGEDYPFTDEEMFQALFGGSDSEATEQMYDGENEDANTSDEDDVIVPQLMPVDGMPDSPEVAPFPNERKPCRHHQNMVMDEIAARGQLGRYQWMPACHVHGRKYSPEQCLTSTESHDGRCWCVDRRGNPITGFIEKSSSMKGCQKILRSSK